MKNFYEDVDSDVYKVKRHIVNLDKPESARWNDITDEYKEYFPKILEQVDNILLSLGKVATAAILAIVNTYEKLGMLMYKDELRSISDRANISLGKLILMQLCYEMFSACTSTGFKVKNKNIHFRTMDWDMPDLKQMVIEIEFQKKR